MNRPQLPGRPHAPVAAGLPPPITPITMPAQVRPVTSMATTMQRLPASMAGGQAVVLNRPAAGVLQRSPMILQPGQQAPGMLRIAGPGQPAAPRALTTGIAGRNILINQPGMTPLSVPLQTLQGLRPGQGIPTGQQGHLLVKTENGQYQILKVGSTQPAGSTSTTTTMHTRPPVQPSPQIRPPMPQVINRTVAVAAPAAAAVASPASANPAVSVATAPTTSATPSAVGAARAPAAASASGMGQQMTPDTAKLKCKNFLATLLRLASEQPAGVAQNVRTLIQGLIDGAVDPEVFTTRLQRELNSSPQPCLVPFLKKSLPYLQTSLRSGELTIEGVRAPSTIAAPQGPSMVRLQRQTIVTSQPPPGVFQTPGIIRAGQPRVQTVMAPRAPIARAAYAPAPAGLLPSHPAPLSAAGAAAVSALTTKSPVIPPPKMPTQALQMLTQQQPHPQQQFHPSKLPTAALSSSPAAFRKTVQSAAAAASTSATASSAAGAGGPGGASASSYSVAGDEDINDVAAMGGVNLAEESQRMQGATDLIGTQIRSCRDETFLQTGQLKSRIAKICRDRGLEEPTPDVIAMVSHATQDRLKTLLEKLSVVAEHRMDVIRRGDAYEATQDVRSQMRFVSELDKLEKRRHEEAERELLLRAAKSRTKTEDPEREKLKAKAREMQRVEEEMMRHEKANNTALMAIGGPKNKRLRLDDLAGAPSGGGGAPGYTAAGSAAAAAMMSSAAAAGLTGPSMVRPRTKRVNLRDLLFLMEQEKGLKRSSLLWKAHAS